MLQKRLGMAPFYLPLFRCLESVLSLYCKTTFRFLIVTHRQWQNFSDECYRKHLKKRTHKKASFKSWLFIRIK